MVVTAGFTLEFQLPQGVRLGQNELSFKTEHLEELIAAVREISTELERIKNR
jgi:hypothetical protein